MRLTLIAAQSLDGFITRHDTPGSDFASDADRAFFREALRSFDCCVMGANSYREARATIQKNLMPDRLRVVLTHNPESFANESVPNRVEFTRASAPAIVADLDRRGLNRGAILGGAQIHSAFLNAGLVDELWLTVEPLLFGGGKSLLASRTSARLTLLSSQNLAPSTLLLKYRVEK